VNPLFLYLRNLKVATTNFLHTQSVVAGFSLRLEALACGKQRNLKVATTIKFDITPPGRENEESDKCLPSREGK